MGNRGNQDYFKIAGTRTRDRDIARMAHEQFARQRADERHQPHRPTGPQAVPLQLHIPPKYAEPVPETRPVEGIGPAAPPVEPPSFRSLTVLDAARFLVGTARSAAIYLAGAAVRAGRRAVERGVRAITPAPREAPR